jgi:hypothetical protein
MTTLTMTTLTKTTLTMTTLTMTTLTMTKECFVKFEIKLHYTQPPKIKKVASFTDHTTR